jgi:hypothetical protein
MKTDQFKELLALPLDLKVMFQTQNFLEVQIDSQQVLALPSEPQMKQKLTEFIQQIPKLCEIINSELVDSEHLIMSELEPNFKLIDLLKHNVEFRQCLFARFEQLGMFFEHQDIYMTTYEQTNLSVLMYNIFFVYNRLVVMSLYSAAANYVNYILGEQLTPAIQDVLQQIKWCDAKNLGKMCTEYVQSIENKYVRLGVVVFRRRLPSSSPIKRIIHTKAKLQPLIPQDYTLASFQNFVVNGHGKLCFGLKFENNDDKFAAGVVYKNCLVALGKINDLPSSTDRTGCTG